MSAARFGGGWVAEMGDCESQKPMRHTYRIAAATVPQGRTKGVGEIYSFCKSVGRDVVLIFFKQ